LEKKSKIKRLKDLNIQTDKEKKIKCTNVQMFVYKVHNFGTCKEQDLLIFCLWN
jgi:hypothetical protein